jgi:hypothetical protein
MTTIECPTFAICAGAAAAYERWAYGEGFTGGVDEGRRLGFEEGYRAGFDAGSEVAGTRVLLGIEHALGGRLGEILPLLPDAAGFTAFRRVTESTDEPCKTACRSCSRCIRAAVVARNVDRFGQADFPRGAR